MPCYFLLLFRMPGCLDFLYRLFWTCIPEPEKTLWTRRLRTLGQGRGSCWKINGSRYCHIQNCMYIQKCIYIQICIWRHGTAIHHRKTGIRGSFCRPRPGDRGSGGIAFRAARGNANNVILLGARRAGKSSILLNLSYEIPKDEGVIPVIFDASGILQRVDLPKCSWGKYCSPTPSTLVTDPIGKGKRDHFW